MDKYSGLLWGIALLIKIKSWNIKIALTIWNVPCVKKGTKQLWTMMPQSTTFPFSGTSAASQCFPQAAAACVSPEAPQEPAGKCHSGKFQSPSAGDFYIAFIPLDWHPPICERSSDFYQLKFRFNKTTVVGVFFQFMLQEQWHQPQYRTRCQ